MFIVTFIDRSLVCVALHKRRRVGRVKKACTMLSQLWGGQFPFGKLENFTLSVHIFWQTQSRLSIVCARPVLTSHPSTLAGLSLLL